MNPPRRAVLMLHGILLSRWFLWPWERFLRERGHRTLNLSYPSTRSTIEEHAHRVAGRIAEEHARAPIDRLDVVTHSLGGLVARRLLVHEAVPTPHRLVQVSPPNHGSAVARHWRDRLPYRWLYGTAAGRQLGEPPEEIDRICGIPEEVEWGIVMGTVPIGLRDSMFRGPHDGVVSHAEMRMPGVPSLSVPGNHTPLLYLPEMWHAVAGFLERGRFPDAGATRC